MIICCPQCDTNYNIPDETLRPGGRKVRCSTCSHRWQVTPPPEPAMEYGQPETDFDDDDAIGGYEAQSESTAASDIPEQPRFQSGDVEQAVAKSRTSLLAIFGWCSVLVLIACLATFVLARERLAAAFPALEGVYETVGLPIEQTVLLRFDEVTSEEFLEQNQPVIVISGLVINDGDEPLSVPEIEVTLLDSARSELEQQRFQTIESEVAGEGGMTTFEARFPDPPDSARHFSVAFGDDAEDE